MAIELATGLSRDALHIYAALLIQFLAAAITRRTVADFLPWACVLAFAIGNEWADIYSDELFEQWEQKAALHDLWNTILLPTLLLLLTRFAPGLMRTRVQSYPDHIKGNGRR